jgi:hypothetical protein
MYSPSPARVDIIDLNDTSITTADVAELSTLESQLRSYGTSKKALMDKVYEVLYSNLTQAI